MRRFRRWSLALFLIGRYSCMNCNSLYFGYFLTRRKGE
jgi:hypothetical protein